jgi:hypothetical protein
MLFSLPFHPIMLLLPLWYLYACFVVIATIVHALVHWSTLSRAANHATRLPKTASLNPYRTRPERWGPSPLTQAGLWGLLLLPRMWGLPCMHACFVDVWGIADILATIVAAILCWRAHCAARELSPSARADWRRAGVATMVAGPIFVGSVLEWWWTNDDFVGWGPITMLIAAATSALGVILWLTAEEVGRAADCALQAGTTSTGPPT